MLSVGTSAGGAGVRSVADMVLIGGRVVGSEYRYTDSDTYGITALNECASILYDTGRTSAMPNTISMLALAPKNAVFTMALATMATDVANPFRMLSANLTTTATISPPIALMVMTAHVNLSWLNEQMASRYVAC